MFLRYYEISHAHLRILNPFTLEKVFLVGEICDLRPGMCLLDLACGKGEMLCQWASRFGIDGRGVDFSEAFLNDARKRAIEMNVADRVLFETEEAAEHVRRTTDVYDIVNCIGATWIGGGLTGTLDIMKRALRNSASLVVVGEAFWREPPPDDAYGPQIGAKDAFVSLEGTLDRFHSMGFDLLEMVLANGDNWDRYEASQWKTGKVWLDRHPDDPDAGPFRDWLAENQRVYLKTIRRYMGWGVFVLRLR